MITRPRERWQRVQAVFAAAVECDGADRGRLLDERCGEDHELRREVESLLASHEDPGPIDRLAPAIAPAASWARTQFAGWEGRRVGQYAVLELVEAGGMGVVYKAHDPRLGRHVALKFLHPHLDSESAPKQRFLIEARAAAALDHPNICTILEIGETDSGQLFLAMPLYDGETVAARLKRGRLAVRRSASDRRAGRARDRRGSRPRRGAPRHQAVERHAPPRRNGKSPRFRYRDDRGPGLRPAMDGHFGTLPYMSPEHVRGTAIDSRSDIWSLGVLLHEMLTGVRPFDAGDATSLAEAILNREPIWSQRLIPKCPRGSNGCCGVRWTKSPDSRYQSMAVFTADLLALAPAADPAAFGPIATTRTALTGQAGGRACHRATPRRGARHPGLRLRQPC